jgi:guanylate kinase
LTTGLPATGNPRLVVLSGPSGVGKSSVIADVRERHPRVWLSVSVTTRAPRPGEVDGEHYRFVDDAAFDRMVAEGALLEHATFAGFRYGTPRGPVEEHLSGGTPVLLEIELQGARQVRTAMPGALLVFLAPPSWDELVRRLTDRGTEDQAVVRRRLDAARIELAAEDEFDEVIINSSVRETSDRLVALIGIP